MTGTMTSRIVSQVADQLRSIHRDYMAFMRQMECVRVVLNPVTQREIEKEFHRNHWGRGSHEGFWIQDVIVKTDKPVQFDARMLGIKVITDESVPEGEIEIRAVLQRSWEPVL